MSITDQEYMDVIIPATEADIEGLLQRAETFDQGSDEQKALVLSAKIKINYILWIQLHIQSVTDPRPEIQERINRNKEIDKALKEEIDHLNVDIDLE
jgi:hypothetical protein